LLNQPHVIPISNFNSLVNYSNNQTVGKQAKTNGGPKTNHNNKSRNQEGGRGGNQQQSQSAQQDKGQAQQQQQPREPREPKEPRVAGDEDEKKFGRYPDGQQVFVGNLNQDLSEAELRTYFSQYGKVMDMRINTNSKQQSGRRLPNYGFVVFEEKQAVENLLSASKANSITYKNDKGIYSEI
jgi:RNA-binding protein Musashi